MRFAITDAARAAGWLIAMRFAVTIVAIAITMVGCSAAPDSSATWHDLQARLPRMSPAERAAALERFVADHHGTPIVEDDSHLVFLVQDPGNTPPRIVGDFNAWAATQDGVDLTAGATSRVDGTDWWALESAVDADARVEYMVARPNDVRSDPLNPHQVASATGPRSEVRMPRWKRQPELDDVAPVPEGHVSASTLMSTRLGSRRTWVYRPPGYDGQIDTRYPTVYILDGASYVEPMATPHVLDRLIAAGTIPPVIAVFVEPDDRLEEYAQSADWPVFMATEVVPAVDAAWRTRREPGTRVILGSSLGATGATRLALAYPEVFGRIAVLAPPETAVSSITEMQRAATQGHRRWFVLGGRYDELRPHAERLSNTLRDTGERVTYLEVPEGHNRETFRGHLDDGLRALLDIEDTR